MEKTTYCFWILKLDTALQYIIGYKLNISKVTDPTVEIVGKLKFGNDN